VTRLGQILQGKRTWYWEHSLPFILLIMSIYLRSHYYTNTTTDNSTNTTISTIISSITSHWFPCLCRWSLLYHSCSLVFLHIGLAAGHHHPDIYHAGDLLPPELQVPSTSTTNTTASTSDMVKKMDWGIYQILSVGFRETIDQSLFLASISFGQHIAHHLFPTIDQSLLASIIPIIQETCREFGIEDLYGESLQEKTLQHRDQVLQQQQQQQSQQEMKPIMDNTFYQRRKLTVLEGYLGFLRQVFKVKSTHITFPSQFFYPIKQDQQHQ
jgi:hypothetical protein